MAAAIGNSQVDDLLLHRSGAPHADWLTGVIVAPPGFLRRAIPETGWFYVQTVHM